MHILQVTIQIIQESLRLKWMRVERDDSVIKSLEEAVRQFDIEIEDLIIKLKKGANLDG